jgi:hypothetical protein
LGSHYHVKLDLGRRFDELIWPCPIVHESKQEE